MSEENSLRPWPTVALFTLIWVPVLGLGTWLCREVLGPEYVKISIISGGIVYFACFLSITVSYWARKRYGRGLIEVLLAGGLRAGIPAGAVLVFFSVLDKILFYKTVFIVFGYYVVILVFEVWLFTRNRDSVVVESTNDKE